MCPFSEVKVLFRPRESGPVSEGKGVTVRWGLKEAGATATT
jgi:hypothetical protein